MNLKESAKGHSTTDKSEAGEKMASSGTTSSDAIITVSSLSSTNTGGLTDTDLKKAQDQLERLLSNDFFRNKTPRELPTFDAPEIGIGPQLGIGGFGVVSEVECIKLRDKFTVKDSHNVDTENNNQSGDKDVDPSKVQAHERRTADETNTTEEVLDACAQRNQVMDDAQEVLVEEDEMYDDLGKYLSEIGLDIGRGQDADNHNSSSLPSNPDEARVFMAHNTLRDGHARYAIKTLKPDLSDKDKKYAVMDMAIEAKFLAVISHPNIVKMRGTASTDSLRYDYFIVMDRLYGTLDERIDEWAEQEKEGTCCGLWGGDSERLKEIRLERITALYDVTKAMEYLHENNIIYRDIKPENLGFDIRGDLKVFDFGLSRVLQKKDQLDNGTYKLTACSGSLRYMAPEVVQSKPYNLKADVFSFATLAWHVLELKYPFENLSAMRYIEVVCKDGWRPALSTKWPALLRSVLKDSWDASLANRPDFTRVGFVIRGMMKQMADRDRSDIHDRSSHMNDRSNHSLHSRLRRMRSNSRGTESSMDHSNSNHFRRHRREAADE